MVPTLAADDALAACLASLRRQTLREIEVIVVDNSGRNSVREQGVRVIANHTNVGFGAAINQGVSASASPYVATLNDDAEAHPGWLEALVKAAAENDNAGMFASKVRLAPDRLDSAGMLMAADGTSKQRGHGEPPERFGGGGDTLFPSGSAALYRRSMLHDVGGFDESFFLYCEDTDLGLRAQWAGWRCLYVPGAVVDHRYSHSAGRASPLKAYLVERNRLFTIVKNFPLHMLMLAPFAQAWRYFWHVRWMLAGRGSAAEFRRGASGWLLPWLAIKAHAACLVSLGPLLSKRSQLVRRVSGREFAARLRAHWIPVRQVAAL